MVVGNVPSFYSVDDVMFLLAWTYEKLAHERTELGDAKGASDAMALARAGYRDVFAEKLGVTLKGDTDMRWVPWRNNQELWVEKAAAYLSSGDDLLACAAYAEILTLRRKDEESGVTMKWSTDAERQLWLQASRCAVRTGTAVDARVWAGWWVPLCVCGRISWL